MKTGKRPAEDMIDANANCHVHTLGDPTCFGAQHRAGDHIPKHIKNPNVYQGNVQNRVLEGSETKVNNHFITLMAFSVTGIHLVRRD